MSGKHKPVPARQSNPPTNVKADARLVSKDGASAAHISMTAGPLPTPETLEAYENAHPGLAKKWVDSWQSEEKHRREMEREFVAVQKYEAGTRRLTIWIGAGVLLAIAAATAVAAHNGATAAATALGGGGGLVGLISVVRAALGLRKSRDSSSEH